MKEEDRKLLLKDLSGRLPYGVKVANLQADQECYVLESIDIRDNEVYICKYEPEYAHGYTDIEVIRPYLFPLSNITEEDLKSLYTAVFSDATEVKVTYTEDEDYYEIEVKYGHYTCYYDSDNLLNDINYVGYDWLNAHHYDYRDLIEKGLAISAVNLNIY